MTKAQDICVTIYVGGKLSREELKSKLCTLFSKAFTELLRSGFTPSECRRILAQADEYRIKLFAKREASRPLAFYIGPNFFRVLELPWVNTSWVSVDKAFDLSLLKNSIELFSSTGANGLITPHYTSPTTSMAA